MRLHKHFFHFCCLSLRKSWHHLGFFLEILHLKPEQISSFVGSDVCYRVLACWKGKIRLLFLVKKPEAKRFIIPSTPIKASVPPFRWCEAVTMMREHFHFFYFQLISCNFINKHWASFPSVNQLFFLVLSLGFGDEVFSTLTQQMCAIIRSFAKHKTILSKSCHVNCSLSVKM